MTKKNKFKPNYKSYRTKRLVLRPFLPSDWQTWVEAQESSKSKQNSYDIDPLPLQKRTKKLFLKTLKRHKAESKSDSIYRWQIFLKKTGDIVGWIDIATISRKPYQMANLGYFVLNHHRKKGYAKETLLKIIPSALKDLGYHRLEAVIDLENKLSRKLAQSVGMYKEGVKKHYWFQNGRWEDQMVYIATPELWRKKQRLSK